MLFEITTINNTTVKIRAIVVRAVIKAIFLFSKSLFIDVLLS